MSSQYSIKLRISLEKASERIVVFPVMKMRRLFKSVICVFLICTPASLLAEDGVSRDQIKQLDEQVQDIKKEALDISSQLIQLEELYAYPANTRLSVYIEMDDGQTLPFDVLDIKIDGKAAATHTYSKNELSALRRGGADRVYIGNIADGEHVIKVEIISKSGGAKENRSNAEYRFNKLPGAKVVAISLAGSDSSVESISFRED